MDGGKGGGGAGRVQNVQVASFRRHISMNCLISDTSFGMMGEFEMSGDGQGKESVAVLFGKTHLFAGIFDYDLVVGLWLE